MSDESLRALGTCQVCANGELVFSVLRSTRRLTIECLECMTGYADPRDLGGSELLRMDEVESRIATRQEVESAGMVDLLVP